MSKLYFCLFLMLLTLSNCKNENSKKLAGNKNQIINIGIISIVEHPSLDSARFSFMKVLNEYANKKKIKIIYHYESANNNISNEKSILTNYIDKKYDLIHTIGTRPTQSYKSFNEKIPCVFSCVTDPLGSKLVELLQNPGGVISGASDLTPIKDQLLLIKSFFPEKKRIGFIYNSAEDNSTFLANTYEKISTELGMTLVKTVANNSNDVATAVSSIINKIDCMIMPTDNTAASAVLVIGKICYENNIPFFSTEEESVRKGLAIASHYVNYSDVGIEAGKIACQVFDGINISEIPVQYLKSYVIVINQNLLNKYKVKIDDQIKSNAKMY